MIKKTSKNLGAYKQQVIFLNIKKTLSIQRNLIGMADRYGEVAGDVLMRKRLNKNVSEYEESV